MSNNKSELEINHIILNLYLSRASISLKENIRAQTTALITNKGQFSYWSLSTGLSRDPYDSSATNVNILTVLSNRFFSSCSCEAKKREERNAGKCYYLKRRITFTSCRWRKKKGFTAIPARVSQLIDSALLLHCCAKAIG